MQARISITNLLFLSERETLLAFAWCVSNVGEKGKIDFRFFRSLIFQFLIFWLGHKLQVGPIRELKRSSEAWNIPRPQSLFDLSPMRSFQSPTLRIWGCFDINCIGTTQHLHLARRFEGLRCRRENQGWLSIILILDFYYFVLIG